MKTPKKKKIEKFVPTVCKRCFGYGLHRLPKSALVEPFAMTRQSYEIGWGTIECPVCGSNPRPNGYYGEKE